MPNPFVGDAFFDLHMSGQDPPKASTMIETEERRGMNLHDDTDVGKRAETVEWRMIADRPTRSSVKALLSISRQQKGQVTTVQNNADEATPKVLVLDVKPFGPEPIFPIINQDGDRVRLDVVFTLRNTQ